MRAILLCGLIGFMPLAAHADGIGLSASLGDIGYRAPRRFGLSGPGSERQGRLGVDGKFKLGSADLSFGLDRYFSSRRSGFVDGRVEWQGGAGAWRVKLGLLRETWGRSESSRLNLLSAPTLVQGLLADLPRIAQPGTNARFGVGHNSHLDLTVLGPLRHGPLPASDDRFGFGVPAHHERPSGELGQGAIAARFFVATPVLDWGVHAFRGVSRDPSTVSLPSGAVSVRFDDITQFGYEAELSPGDWRLWSEGFWRDGSRDRHGQVRPFGNAMVGAHYQWFAAFGGANDIVLGAEFHRDSRGVAADAPMRNALVLGAQLLRSDLSQWKAEFSSAFDLKNSGRLDRLRLGRQISEAPFAELVFSATHVKAGKRASLLDVFAADASVSAVLNWKF